MYYISRVEIDTGNRRKISELTHLGAYHNWVEKSFPEEFAAGERSRKLWRVDQLKGRSYLLIVSQGEPDMTQLEAYGVPGTGQCKTYDAFLQSLIHGQKMSFRLTANPARAAKQEAQRGKVCPHTTVEKQLEYLEKRAERLGFSLVDYDYQIVQRDFPILRKKGGKSIKLARAIYEGSLIIENAEIFRKTLTEGVGKEKAYGFGMMTVIQ
ncbi:type I-E CRISPR-associated protein Cas6/Cse3/CasE [Kineothrix sp. MB12-C1]|uniref:type I-E CRISPR-associated protein Cas6/Cse3/CasE n=1 Tax=Kineothrix sp. MB12-C1 TaxID=3070215 RepID=UPI0027D23B43|nr:type I-E CRISPR-associated protein Cas6/Cse3/CasE [Kineothrix sp. MB12-C1]WMC93080.1 type I-E CRISPR-associated protein Cas6/Cse3/CasE [Kineothrix sp. MB12-C1]